MISAAIYSKAKDQFEVPRPKPVLYVSLYLSFLLFYIFKLYFHIPLRFNSKRGFSNT